MTRRIALAAKRGLFRPCLSSRQGFTLAEILVVLAIVVILFGITLPVFNSLSKTSALRSGVAQVRSTLSLARQYAIANRAITRFVIADDNINFNTTTNRPHVDKCLRAYAVFDETNSRYVKEWEYLPDGVVFDWDTLAIGSATNVNRWTPLTGSPLPFPNSASPATTLVGIRFRSDGQATWGTMANPDSSSAIIVAEGAAVWPTNGIININDPSQYRVQAGGRRRAIVVHRRGGRTEVIE